MAHKWQVERERKLNLSLEDRRKEYKRDYVPLSDVPTWKEQLKKIEPEDKNGDPKYEKLKKSILYDLQIKDIDLTDKISVFQGDITKLEIDAIVNAANNSLMGGGGVDGAIHRGAGPWLKKENLSHDGCPDGEARLSGGYNLPTKYIISTVGPQCENPRTLSNCYTNSLQVALDNKIKTIAFPCISTGIYGYPNDEAAKVALKAVRRFMEEHHKEIERVIFCLFLEVDVTIYRDYIPIVFPAKVPGAAKKKSERIEEVAAEKEDAEKSENES